MSERDDIEELRVQLGELSDHLHTLKEKEDTHYAEIMQRLTAIEGRLPEVYKETDPRTDQKLFDDAREVVIKAQKASTSFLQRKLGIGYSRAAMLMDKLEDAGIIGPSIGSTPRKVLIKEEHPEKNPDTNPSSSRFAHLPTLKKPTRDYGQLTVEALKRIKD